MKRAKWLLLLALLASSGIFAQTIGVTIGLTQVGPNFLVDGQTYSGSQTFFWPVGSIHILQFPFSRVHKEQFSRINRIVETP